MNGPQPHLETATHALAGLERMVQIAVATLVVLGTTLLAMGQQNVAYAIFAVIGAATAVIVCDMKRWIRLGPDATTFAALLACCVLVVQVIRNVEESHLLNVANVLIYLEVILLFQAKEDRTYWSLMALSLLQVVVAAALNLGLAFGALLAVYVIVAFLTLLMFYVLRVSRPFVTQQRSVPDAGRPELGIAKELQLFVAAIDPDEPRRVLSRSLARRVARMVAVMVGGTVILFFALPRFGNATWQNVNQEQVATVGFTEEVRLDDISRILESPEQVMRVEFTDLAGNPYQVDGEPSFRGTVLSDYRDGVWRQRRGAAGGRLLQQFTSFDLAEVVLQRITLQPGSHSALFHVAPCHYVEGAPVNLELAATTGQLTLANDDAEFRSAYRYTLGTTAFRNGWEKDLIPSMSSYYGGAAQFESLRATLPGLANLATDVLARSGLQQAGVFERAKALENHFRRSGLYSYSLEASPQRNRNVDPIEDFVTNHRSGHCEYFAGALTLMLRSQGIPARMVVGYKGGEFNNVGNYYIVRQLHAHAWVEAYLRPNEIPEEERDGAEEYLRGAWLTLDPTPGSDDVNVRDQRLAVVRMTREFLDYCQVLWDDYVLGLNAARQEQYIYGPIRRNLQTLGRMLFSTEAWSLRWQRVQAWIVSAWQRRYLGMPVLVWCVLSLCLVVATLYRLRHRLRVGGLRRLWHGRRAGTAGKESVPYFDEYVRYQAILSLLGIQRQPQQTVFELAGQAAHHLSRTAATQAWQDLPWRMADAYCRLRYGHQEIADDERSWLQGELAELRQAILHGPEGNTPAQSR